jgi:hypothetical protein
MSVFRRIGSSMDGTLGTWNVIHAALGPVANWRIVTEFK